MLENEGIIRLSCFIGMLLLMALLEQLLPRRRRTGVRFLRWTTNLGILFSGSLPLRFIFPLLAPAAALLAADRGWGLLHYSGLPAAADWVITLVVFDVIIYAQHVIFHRIGIFWRFHRVHHTDRDLDASTALRFHPIEIWLSMAIKIGAVFLIGPPAGAVILFEIILNGMALFNHSNFHLPEKLDGILRLAVVTPDMHRVHHSDIRRETDSNFGFNLSLWDRLFRTYTAQPEKGHDGMTIGLREFPEAGKRHLIWTLILPFRNVKQCRGLLEEES
jgi:sterol desaturase/sphingolipid hydroxylase (fatty acid hydroxylase superfamily)